MTDSPHAVSTSRKAAALVGLGAAGRLAAFSMRGPRLCHSLFDCMLRLRGHSHEK